MVFKIAIDGPAGSGKSSVAEIVTERLGFQRINSGNIYRAITYTLLSRFDCYTLDDPKIVEFIENLTFDFDRDKIIYNGHDISKYLRSKRIDMEVINVAKPLYIRGKAYSLQKDLIAKSQKGLVMEGRDIGTNVLPDATLKIFLTASLEVRARRRHLERPSVSYEDTLEDMRKRDFEDISRKHGPLTVAPDATIVNTDEHTAEQTADIICSLFYEKTGHK